MISSTVNIQVETRFPNKQDMLRLLKDDVIVDILQKIGPVFMLEQEYQI